MTSNRGFELLEENEIVRAVRSAGPMVAASGKKNQRSAAEPLYRIEALRKESLGFNCIAATLKNTLRRAPAVARVVIKVDSAGRAMRVLVRYSHLN